MLAPSVVALYGRSLILATVARSLEGRKGVRVVTVEEGPSLEAAIEALAPTVLMVDLHQVDVASALPVLDARPELLLVGLDPSGARLLVLSGRDARSVTIDELLRLVERQLALAGEATPSDEPAVLGRARF